VRELAWYVTAFMEGSEGVWRLDSSYNDDFDLRMGWHGAQRRKPEVLI